MSASQLESAATDCEAIANDLVGDEAIWSAEKQADILGLIALDIRTAARKLESERVELRRLLSQLVTVADATKRIPKSIRHPSRFTLELARALLGRVQP